MLNELPDLIILMHEEFKWFQSLNYEHVSFRCRKCHEHGHLYGDFPLNKNDPNLIPTLKKYEEGFQKFERKKRYNRRHPPMERKADQPTTSNSFKTLEELREEIKERETK